MKRLTLQSGAKSLRGKISARRLSSGPGDLADSCRRLSAEVDALKRRLERERKARAEAEQIAERATREAYERRNRR